YRLSLSCPLIEQMPGDLDYLPGNQIERAIVFEQDGTLGYVGSAPAFFNSRLAFLARATPWHSAGICGQRPRSSSRPRFSIEPRRRSHALRLPALRSEKPTREVMVEP
ncbi:hypothetical protein, partial [Paraburkholderia hospita]